MKKILAYGTFDIFHEGHKSFLRQARLCGDWLRVVVARDQIVLEVKGLLPLNNENVRKEMVEQSGLADEVKLGDLHDPYKEIREYRPDVICLGYDQSAFVEGLSEKLKELGLGKTEIVRLLPYKPDIFKSSKLKNKS